MKKKTAKLIALMLAATLLAGCSNGNNDSSSSNQGQTTTVENNAEGATDTPSADSGEEKIVTLSNIAAWESLNPFTSNRDQHVVFMYPMYESWVTITSEGEILPRLFESWEQSEDGAVLTCKLREDATWSDGEPITAEDVAWTYQTWADPKIGLDTPRSTSYFVGTDDMGNLIEGEEFGIKALDDYTVELTYKEEQKSTVLNELYSLRYTFVLPKHCLEDVAPESLLTDPFWENPVTSGAFTLSSIISGERMEYVARDDYYLGRPQMDRLIIRVIPADNILSAMLAGEVDGTVYGSQMSYSDYELAKENASLQTYEAAGFGNNHILLNNEKLDQNARLAIDHAINKESIINDVLFGYARPAISGIVPENPYRNEAVTGNPYDLDQAREYLEQSDYDTNVPLTIILNSANSVGQSIAVLVQQQLAQIGLTVNIETYDNATVSSKLFAGEFDLGIMSSASNPFEPSESRFYFQLSPNGWNRITDETWLELYDDSQAGLSVEERKPYYDELQERLVAEVPMIFLYHADVLFVNSDRISGMDYEEFSLKNWRYEEWQVK